MIRSGSMPKRAAFDLLCKFAKYARTDDDGDESTPYPFQSLEAIVDCIRELVLWC
jgi:hypothetical protein